MPHWEYLHLSLAHNRERGARIAGEQVGHFEQVEAILNALGAEGWEVIAYHYHLRHVILLKRPSPQSAAAHPA